MQTKYRTMLKVGAGVLISGTLLYFLLRPAKEAKSLDEIMTKKLNLTDEFGDAPYILPQSRYKVS